MPALKFPEILDQNASNFLDFKAEHLHTISQFFEILIESELRVLSGKSGK